jgi:CubicO group peptidase (beta-lactamase class C family)
MKFNQLIAVMVCGSSLICAAGPDESALGKDQNYPVGSVRNWTQPPYRIGSWSAPQKIEGLPHRVVEKSTSPKAALKASTIPTIRYSHNGTEFSVDQYFERQRVTSLLILKDGKIALEKYQYGRGPESRFFSYSMAKSITSLLVGIALDKGMIKSLDDPAELYSPTLKGTAYGSTSVRDLLRMASGIDFTENYAGSDDFSKLSRSAFTDSPALTDLFKSYSRKVPAGSRFNYSSLESLALGYVLKDASGKSIADLTKEWLWNPMGAEDEAYWIISKSGMEGTYCCFAASSRDWAKLGLVFAQNGAINGQKIVSEGYLKEAVSVDILPAALKTGLSNSFAGYGYQTWLLPGPGRQFYMKGIHGQAMFVDAESGVVMLHTGAFTQPSARTDPAPYDEQLSLWHGVLKSLAR